MSIGFNWFKDYEIHSIESNCIEFGGQKYYDDIYYVKYLYGGSTSHSVGNITYIQDLLEKYNDGKSIPNIDERFISSELDRLDLIEPEEMSRMCQRVLDNESGDMNDLRERIEWFQQLSNQGYYLVYESYY